MKRTTQRKMKMRTRRCIFYITVYLIALSACAKFVYGSIPKPTHSETYRVQSGDCIWSIAKLSDSFEDIDRRYIVDDIMELSGCKTSKLEVGQVIKIPMYKGK